MCCQIASSLHTLNSLTRGYSASSLLLSTCSLGGNIRSLIAYCLLVIGVQQVIELLLLPVTDCYRVKWRRWVLLLKDSEGRAWSTLLLVSNYCTYRYFKRVETFPYYVQNLHTVESKSEINCSVKWGGRVCFQV